MTTLPTPRLARRLVAIVGAALLALDLSAATTPAMRAADREILVYSPHETPRFELPGDDDAPATVFWSLKDWQNQPRGGGEIVAKAEAGKRVVALPSPGPGWFRLRLEKRDAAGAVLAMGEFALTVGEAAKSTGRFFRYGACAHLLRNTPDDFRLELQAAADLGIDMMRDGQDWHGIQPAPGQWRFERMDALLDELDARHIELQWPLGFTARWATTGNPQGSHADWNKTAPKLEPWLEFVTTTVKRYQKRIRWWEIWNEPDIGFWNAPVADYVTLFDRSAAAIKAVDPELQVMNGGFAMVKRPPNPEFIRDFLAAADTRHWDIRAYHDYMSFPDMIVRQREHDAAYRGHALANAPAFVNEGGFHTLLAGGEAEQAITLAKKFSAAPAFGINGYLWYNLRDKGVDPTDKEDHFGLTGRAFQLKPAYAAFRHLIHELSARRHQASAQPRDGALQAHLYAAPEAGGEHVLVLWNETRGLGQPMWIACPEGTRVVSATDLVGAPLAVTAMEGGALIEVTDRPAYLRLAGRAALPVVSPLLELPKTLALVAGREIETTIRVRNPLARALTPQVAWQTDRPELQVVRSTPARSVAPGGETVLATTFRIESSTTNGVLLGRLTLAADAEPFAFRLPYEGVRVVPRHRAGSAGDAALEIGLRSRDDIHNLYEALIRPEMNWRGTDDLSGTARLACTDEELILEVDVTDDRHVQTRAGNELWNQDSLQLGLTLSGAPVDYSELGFARDENGELHGWVYRAAPGVALRSQHLLKQTRVAITREGTVTRYQIGLSWKSLGLPGAPTEPFRLSFIVNDDDGAGRKQWLRLSPGMGDSLAPGLFPLFLAAPNP